MRIWDLRQRLPDSLILRGHRVGVTAIALAPDGGRLASASYDKSVRVWDLCDPEAPALVLAGHQDGASSVALSPDGNGLASVGLDKTVRVWDLLQPKAQHRYSLGIKPTNAEE